MFGAPVQRGESIIIIGGGRVGRAAGRALEAVGLDYRIVEQQADRVRDPRRYVIGDAADLEVLQHAGIENASAALITTHDDDVNVYLTIYCRRLRPDMQVISRARFDRNVSTLHRAGADAVLSYASTGADAIWNVLTAGNTLQLAEGLDVFHVRMPSDLVGQTLVAAHIGENTGCAVVAVANGDRTESNPDQQAPLREESDLILIGDRDSKSRFHSRYRTP